MPSLIFSSSFPCILLLPRSLRQAPLLWSQRIQSSTCIRDLKAKITYEHNVRVETYPFPIDGVREAIYNALAHNNYARCVPIQIRIRDDAMFISNSCILPSGWDVESLLQPHRSVPFNPAIANAFYRAGYIETWGRGIQKIYESCKELGIPAPEYSIVGEDITVKFTAHDTI